MRITARNMNCHALIVGIFAATLWLTVSAYYEEYPTECPKDDPMNYTVLLPHETDCEKFYACHKGMKILMYCPFMDDKGNRLHFNNKLHVCDYPEDAGCMLTTTTHQTMTTDEMTTMKPTTSEMIPTTEEPEETTTTMQPTTKTTPMPTTINPTTVVGSTEGSTMPEVPTSSTTMVEKTTTEEVELTTPAFLSIPVCTNTTTQVYFPHESHNHLFYECRYGDLIRRECVGNLVFVVSQQRCVQPLQSLNLLLRLNNQSSIADENSLSIKSTSLCASNLTCERLAHECSCTKYYVCINGDAVLRECPSRLSFNPEIKDCDLPANVNCSGSSINPNVTIPTSCPPNNDGWAVNLAHETNCSLFYKCNRGEKFVLSCKSGLYFNPRLQVCDWPCQAGCTAEGGQGMNTCESDKNSREKQSYEENQSSDLSDDSSASDDQSLKDKSITAVLISLLE